MSLMAALNTARSSLASTAAQIAVSGRNVSGAEDPSYARKIALVATSADGAGRVVSVGRAANVALFQRLLETKSTTATEQARLDGLNRLHETVGDTADGASPGALVGVLSDALIQYANAPDDAQRGQAVVTAAIDLAQSLNRATTAVQAVRSDADTAIASSVANVNDLLARLAELNTVITRGTIAGSDVTGSIDQRDSLLTDLAQHMGITVIQREYNDIAVFTDSGVPLFDKTARSVRFEPTPVFTAGAAGNAVVVDGVPITGAGATMPLRSGQIAGLSTLRDQTADTYQAQLDEIARVLVAAFAESDQSTNGGPDLAGLFTWSGGPAISADGVRVAGLAASLKVNAAVDPAQGGAVARLRDGGVNGVDYGYNATGAASFAGRLTGLVTSMSGSWSFDAAAMLTSPAGVAAFASGSAGWLESERQSVSAAHTYQQTLHARVADALSNETGVSLDDEYAIQLQLERSYAASSKLIGVIDELFRYLLQTLR